MALQELQATALTWAFERLVRHPAVAERARAAATAEDVAFLDAVVDEVLPHRPPIIGAFRTLDHPTEVTGVLLPAGTLTMAAFPLLQHRYGTADEPPAFHPDLGTHRSPLLAFGGGERRCLGADVARATLRCVIAAVLTRARLRPPRFQPEPARLVGTALVPGRLGTVIREPGP